MRRLINVGILIVVQLILGCTGKKNIGKSENMVVETPNNRPAYKILTASMLDTIKDVFIEQVIFENIIAKFDSVSVNDSDIIAKLSKGRSMLFFTWILEGEVYNGGFNQFFYNSPEYAERVLEGYKTLGAKEYVDLVQRAISTHNKIKPHLDSIDNGTLEAFSESYEDNPLNDLDNEFYDLQDKNNISPLRIKYIRNHISEFIDR
jgi:hypothetical protein